MRENAVNRLPPGPAGPGRTEEDELAGIVAGRRANCQRSVASLNRPGLRVSFVCVHSFAQDSVEASVGVRLFVGDSWRHRAAEAGKRMGASEWRETNQGMATRARSDIRRNGRNAVWLFRGSLPGWIGGKVGEPSRRHTMTPKLFSELGLSAEIQKAIDRLGFEQAAPIQAETIPLLMQGRDIVGQSQTGSGKTAAFAIPAIEKIDPHKRAVQALILCPTRELAVQVSEEVHKLALFKRGITALPIYGGQSYERQFYGLKQGAQIVIGTPGRVMDHMNRGTLNLDAVKMLVLDEADVMLDMGFREDIEFILQAVPPTRQTVFFSATMPRPIQDLIQRYARDPQNVRIQQQAMTVPTVEQVYYEVDRRFKIQLLARLIDIHDLKLGIIFCNTKRMVDELVDHLEAQGYSADRLHGDMTQAMRDRVMNKFRKSGLEFLVATDVAARGIDVDDVEVVFNYDLPYDVEDYVHRIGRTGRAGRSGMAISFVSGRELFQIRNIERFTNSRVHRGRVPTVAEVEEARADVFLQKVRATLQSGEYKRQDHLIERLLEEGFTSTDVASALLHHLQGGEPAPAAKAPRKEDRPAPFGPAERAAPPLRAGQGNVGPRPAPALAKAPAKEAVFPKRPASAPAVRVAPPSPVPAPIAGPGTIPVPAVPVAEPVAAKAPVAETPVARVPEKPTLEQRSPRVEKPAPLPPKTAPIQAAREPAPGQLESAQPKPAAPASPLKPASTVVPAFVPAVVPVPRSKFPQPALGANKPGFPFGKQERPNKQPKAPLPPPKASRSTPEHQTRLFINIGQAMGATPPRIVELIMGYTGLPAKIVGTIDIRERHLFVDIDTEHAQGVAAKLNRSLYGDRKLRVKVG